MTPTMYSPDGRIYQVEYALETVKRGTLAIGVKCNDGVIIAVEENPRALQVSNITQKIFQVDKHIGIAAAGYIPDARVQVDSARFFSQSNRLTYDEPIEVETVAKHLADQSHQFTQYSGVRPYGVALIIAGIDQKGASIYVTDPSGTYVSYAAVSIGENSDAVTEFLEKNYKSDMTLEDVAINLKDEKRDGVKHVKMSWIKLDKQIMEKVSESDLENYVQSAKQKFSK